MLGTTRGLTTLIGGVVAGLMIWRAAETTDGSPGGYWTIVALLAGAGLVFGLAQQVTIGNVGFHRRYAGLGVSAGMFLLGFLPLAVMGGWFILAADPGWWGTQVTGWSDDLGIGGWATMMATYVPVIAFGLGATLAMSIYNEVFAPEVVEEVEERETTPVAPAAEAAPPSAVDRDLATARDRVREPELVSVGPETADIRSAEPAGVGAAAATPTAVTGRSGFRRFLPGRLGGSDQLLDRETGEAVRQEPDGDRDYSRVELRREPVDDERA